MLVFFTIGKFSITLNTVEKCTITECVHANVGYYYNDVNDVQIYRCSLSIGYLKFLLGSDTFG